MTGPTGNNNPRGEAEGNTQGRGNKTHSIPWGQLVSAYYL